jgi:hypothetical protein
MNAFTKAIRRPSGLAPLAGKIVMPQDARFDEARRAWNPAVDQEPAAVVFAESAQDVTDAVLFAAERGQRIAAQPTGHGAAALGPLNDTILVKTERMRGLTVDPVERIARAEAGVLSRELVRAAAKCGLTPLTGSSADVGVVGYTLGGGQSLLGRKYGPAANDVRPVELVIADGSLVHVDRDQEPDRRFRNRPIVVSSSRGSERGRHGSNPRAPACRPRKGHDREAGNGALGGPAHVSQLRRNPQTNGHPVDHAGPRALTRGQGDGRPGQPHPRQPQHRTG